MGFSTVSVSKECTGEGETHLHRKLLEEICRLNKQCLKLSNIGHDGPSCLMGLGRSFGDNQRLRHLTSSEVTWSLNILAIVCEALDRGSEFAGISLELRQAGHGSSEIPTMRVARAQLECV